MKDVGNVTRVMPDKRVESLMKFRKRLADNPDVRFITLYSNFISNM
jgi:aubergine-like protein